MKPTDRQQETYRDFLDYYTQRLAERANHPDTPHVRQIVAEERRRGPVIGGEEVGDE